MAVADLENPGCLRKRKRRRTKTHRKLLVKAKVEVRSVEDGFQGSWHPGIVISCDKQGHRRVKYDHILHDDGPGNFVDVVSVSPILDGIGSVTEDRSNYRGSIRPPPPHVELGKWGLPYGLCVDAYHKDAWWEGVIFDHEDGLEERRIFFPDLGDELMSKIHTLRITQDWDEVTEKWQRRGTWIFLELIEQYEPERYIAVSIKQIWYDVREKEGFEKVKEWTCPMRHLWEELVLEVIDDNFSITVDELSRVLTTQVQLESAQFVSDANIPKANMADSFAIVPIDNPLNSVFLVDHQDIVKNVLDCSAGIIDERHVNRGLSTDPDSSCLERVDEKFSMDQLISVAGHEGPNMNILEGSNLSSQDKAVCVLPQVLSVFLSNHAGNFCANSVISSDGIPSTNSRGRNTTNWLPNSLIAEFCPDAVDEYAALDKGMPSKFLLNDVRKHLSYLGWKIESVREKGKLRYRYLSPDDGEYYNSLRQVCKDLKTSTTDTHFSISQDGHRGFHGSPEQPLLIEQPQESQPPNCCPQMVVSPCKSTTDTHFSISKAKDVHRGLHGSREEPLLTEQQKESQPPNYRRQMAVPHHKAFIFKPEYCPEAVVDYYKHGVDRTTKKQKGIMISKAKKHLSAVGWVFKYTNIKSTNNLHYKSPKGKVYNTLLDACKGCMEEGASEGRPVECNYVVEEDEGQLTRNKIFSLASNLDMQEGLVPSKTLSEKWSRDSVNMSQSSNLVGVDHLKVQGSRKHQRKTNGNLLNLTPHLLKRQPNLSAGKDRSTKELIGDDKIGCPKDQCAAPPKLKRRKVCGALNGLRNGLDSSWPTRVLRSSKRVQEVVTPTSSHRNPRTVLSWLIDNNVVLARTKVYYRSRKDSHPMKEGRITREGIKCRCCQKVYTLSGFRSHAGRSYQRPAAKIFLEDGRSLSDCQWQMIHGRRKRSLRMEPHDRMKGNWLRGENDYICTVCHYGGDLILCDQCPSSFHKNCLGLKDVPGGDWFCPCCRCGICGQSKFKEDNEPVIDDSFLTCGQCEHKYHIGCLRKRRADKLESDPKGNWFCSDSCQKICLGLHKLLGKQIPVGVDNLTWSVLKSMKSDSLDTDEPDIDALMESDSRLNVALGVMHECFAPVKEPLTRRDLAEDIIFSRGSDLNRLNFQGFYTVLLERNDELITVATVRIYGDKVAEVPLVGTRFQYRRLGMCRILMNELEKMLLELGVERLVLPAVPSVLNTWTTSFGFSKMTDSERQQFLDYTFLDFQDTIMCQKLLTKIPPAEATSSKRTQHLYVDSDNIDFDGSSTVSEVYQAEQIEDDKAEQIVHQGVHNAAGNRTYRSRPYFGESSPEFSSLENAKYKRVCVNNGDGFKCYKRRRIAANGS